MGLHKEEERRMVRVGMMGVGVGMEKFQVYRERKEYIYFFVANEWLGYCTTVGLILNMGKVENI